MLNMLVVSQYISPHTGGAERYIHEVTSRLENRGIKVHFLSAEGGDDLKISSPFRLLSSGFHPLWPKQVDGILNKIQPDVIFAHFTVPGITDVAIRRAKKHNVPVCLAYHGDVTGPQWYRRVLGNCYYRFSGTKTLSLADRILVCSREYQQASPWLASLEQTPDFISYGVDPVMALGKPKSCAPYLFFAGKPDVRSKGFDVLYKVWLELRKSYPGLELDVAGDSAFAHRYPGARFTGRVDSRRKLADLYASASVTILPSTSSAESFGMVLAESLVAGTPVVGSDIGGISAIVDDGVNGYLAQPGNAESLTRAISMALSSEEKLRKNIRSAHKEYVERYNWDRIAEQVEAVLVKCRDI
jgi:phosphatidyl-myo-inositol alpha-mannosyltransferase